MFSNSIREHSSRNKGIKPSLLFKNETSLGIITMTAVEATVTRSLKPFEWGVLSIGKILKKFTRLEIHAITGFTIGLVEDVITTLLETGLIKRVEFDREQLEVNINRLEKDIGDSWNNVETKRIIKRKVINQFEVTNSGLVALKNERRTSQEIIDMNLVVSSQPFKVFFDEIQLKQIALQELEVSNEVIERIFYLAQKEGDSLDNKIIPVALGGDSIVNAHEVVRANVWIAMEAENPKNPKLIGNSKFDLYITSSAFLRWSNPDTTKNLGDYIEVDNDMRSLVVSTMSNRFDMLEKIIAKNLQLLDDKITWNFKADLEMLYLIRETERKPIEENIAELFLQYRDGWEIGIRVKVVPIDELSARALYGARFHSKVNRQGFTYAEGRDTWNGIVQEAGMSEYESHYDTVLDQLVESAALKKVTPKVKAIVVDLSSILARHQKRSLFWKFSRIKELENFFEKADIKEVYYYGTEKILIKIDDLDSFNAWIEGVNFEYFDTYDEDDTSPGMRFAAENEFHYIGAKVPSLDNNEAMRKLRVDRREINYSFRNRLKIFDLEPMFYWFPSNFIQYLYELYYE